MQDLFFIEQGDATAILKKELWNYKDNDADYHIEIGNCFLKLGYLKEALKAFEKALSIKHSQKALLFVSYTYLNMHKFQQANDYLEKTEAEKMNASEILTAILIKKCLNLNFENEKNVLQTLNDSLEKKVCVCIMRLWEKENIDSDLESLDKKDFNTEDSYFFFIKQLAILGYPSNKLINKMVNIKIDNFISYAKTLNSIGVFKEMGKKELRDFVKEVENNFDNTVISAVYNIAHSNAKNTNEKEYFYHKARLLYENQWCKEEECLLVCAEELSRHLFTKSLNIEKDSLFLKNVLEELILCDQNNIKYRKYYYQLLLYLKKKDEANIIEKSTATVKLNLAKEQNEILYRFWELYGFENCPLISDNCPLCGNDGKMPIIKTIIFNAIPNGIYAKKAESKMIDVSEEVLRKMVNNQPMTVTSEVVSSYLMHLGAYPSLRPYPSVLSENEIILFIHLKKKALKRLIKQGVPKHQIDALALDDSDKKINIDGLISAEDLSVEIVKATKK